MAKRPEDDPRKRARVQVRDPRSAARAAEAGRPAATRPAVEPAPPPPPAPAGSFESSVRYEDERIHAAAVYCSDGRIGLQMDEFLQTGLALPRYDRLLCPGGAVALAGRLQSFWETRGVEEQLRFLVRVHELSRVVLIAHQGCAYYRDRLRVLPENAEREQRKDLEQAAWTVRRIEGAISVEAYFARVVEERIRLEPVALAMMAVRD